MGCNHSGYQSGGTRLLLDAHQLQLVLVCDVCGAERAQLARIDYSPTPELAAAPGVAQGESAG